MTDRTFAERLQAAIDADPDLSPAGLAVKAGLDNSAVRGILSGRVKSPRLNTAIRICDALGTTLEEFMSNAQTPEEHEIVRLVSRLPEHLRRQLIGYGQALLDNPDPTPPESNQGEK